MEKPMSALGFRLMSLMFKIRDLIQPRADVLNEAEIKPGFAVLDFGCGPGGYMAPLVELVGPSGKIYALDMHPLAIHEIKEMANSNRYRACRRIIAEVFQSLALTSSFCVKNVP